MATNEFDGERNYVCFDLDTLFSIFDVYVSMSFSVCLSPPDSQTNVYMDLRLEFLPKFDFASPRIGNFRKVSLTL